MSGYGSNYQQGGGYNGGYGQQPQGQAANYYGSAGQSQGYGQNQNYGQSQGGYDQSQGYNQRDEHGYGQAPPQYQQYASTASHSSNSGHNSHNQGSQNQYGGEGDPEGDRGIMGGIAGGAAGAFGGHKLGGKAGHGTAGTIIGAISGAFAGHKAEDAASEWRDEHKEKKKHEKEEEERRKKQEQEQHCSGNQDGNHGNNTRTRGNFGGNFSESCRDIRLDAHGDYNLHAQCRRTDGSYQSSTISLNQIIENDGGSFRWSSGNSNGSSSYTVQQGDTLRAIALRFPNCSYESLAAHNNISNPDLIYPGQNLQIPGGSARGGGNFGASARNVRLADGGQKLEGELSRNGSWEFRSIILDERISNRDGCLEFV